MAESGRTWTLGDWPEAGARSGTALDLEQDPAFQRREWRVETVGWAVLAAFMVAALAGLLGNGPVSWSQLGSPDGALEVSYQRVAHLDADDTVRVVVQPQAIARDRAQVWLSGTWVEAVEVRRVTPEPSQQVARPGRLGLVLEAPSGQPVELTLAVRAQRTGWTEGRIDVGGSSATFRQLVLP